MQSITAKAMNSINGVEAKCFTYRDHKFLNKNEFTVYCPRTAAWSNPLKFVNTKINYYNKLSELFKWADILHYVSGPGLKFYLDLEWIKNTDKKVFIEFIGSDIRNPDLLSSINPYYAEVFNKGYEYKSIESSDYKRKVQNKFSKIGAIPIVNPEMQLYIDKDRFPFVQKMFLRADVSNFTPIFPKISIKKPLIVHSPSAPIAKGSNLIISTIEKLKKVLNFEFIMLVDKPREEVLNVMQKADIFIDQIILGSYGMASMEAMSFGKPTICYILDEVFENGLPRSCPIVNATPETLEKNLTELIENPTLRNDIGIKSRKFVEKYHDVQILAKDLLDIYNS